MNIKYILTLLVILQSITCSDALASTPDVGTAKGGIVTAVGAAFFDNYKNVFLQKFLHDV